MSLAINETMAVAAMAMVMERIRMDPTPGCQARVARLVILIERLRRRKTRDINNPIRLNYRTKFDRLRAQVVKNVFVARWYAWTVPNGSCRLNASGAIG